MMLDIIETLLDKFLKDIRSGNTNLSEDDQIKIVRILSNVGNPEEMTKTQAAEYLGISRATFDNWVNSGRVPKGEKIGDSKVLRWYKCDLDLVEK